MTQIATQGTLRSLLGDAPWPVDFFAPGDLPGFLDRIYVVESQARWRVDQLDLRLQFAFAGELAIRLPGLDGVSLVFGGDPQIEGLTLIGVRVALGARREIVLDQLSFALRFDPELLTPAPDPRPGARRGGGGAGGLDAGGRRSMTIAWSSRSPRRVRAGSAAWSRGCGHRRRRPRHRRGRAAPAPAPR